MNHLPQSTTIYLDKEQDEKLRKISFEMKLNKDSLVNFWLSKELDNLNPVLLHKSHNYSNSFFLLEDIKAQIRRNIFHSNINVPFHDFSFAYLKKPIDDTYEFLKSPLHMATFQKVIHHFEDNTDIRKWPNVAFRNLRNIPDPKREKSDKKIYVLIERRSHWDGAGGEHIHSIYTSLELAQAQLKDLTRGKEVHNFYGYHIDSYEENGGMEKCCMDVKK